MRTGYYYVEGQDKAGNLFIVVHTLVGKGEDKKSLYKLRTKKDAEELIKNERKLEPDNKYRIVSHTITVNYTDWK